MAEVVGIVASGIAITQLSASILKGSWKLRSAWSQFQDAPKGIEHVLEEVDILAGMLISFEPIINQRIQHNAMKANVLECLGLCQRVAGELEDLAAVFPVNSGQGQGKTKQLALKWKAYYRRDEIINIRERLQRAVNYLNMAVMCYAVFVGLFFPLAN